MIVSLVAALVLSQALMGQTPSGAGSVVLLDFEDAAQFTGLRLHAGAMVAPTTQAFQGKQSAKIDFSAVPDGRRDYPAVIVEGTALKVRDFTSFEALSICVMNPGSDDAELSMAIWDKNGNRSFPNPSTISVKPGRWQQVVARLVLHGVDAKQIGSIHFYQKVNRRPVTLLLDDVQLLSPHAGRLLARIQLARDNLKNAHASATALGAAGQVEPRIAALTRQLDQLERPEGGGAAAGSNRLLELARILAQAQELAGSIRIRNNGRSVVLTGPEVEARLLSDPEKLRLISVLSLNQTRLRDDDFAALAPIEYLETLTLNGKEITGAGFDRIRGNMLRNLSMVNTSAHDDSLKALGKFHRLQVIQLPEAGVTSALLGHLRDLRYLKTLVLSGTGIADTGFAEIGRLPLLETLLLDRTGISGAALRHLEGLTALKTLDLSQTKIDDTGLASLGKLTRLESLTLENTPITGGDFGALRTLDKLVVLNLNGTRVGDSALRQLGKLPRLRRLGLSSTRITDASLRTVLPAAQLEYLDLYGTNITDAGVAHVQNQRNLRELYLAGTAVSDTGLGFFKNLTKLEQLDLTGTQVTDDGLKHLQALTNLAVLKLGKTRISGSGLMHLAGLSKLRIVDLSGTNVTDESLARIARLEDLRTLDLSGTRVTSGGMGHLAAARQLADLRLEATAIDDDGIEALAPLANLRRLNLNETSVTDKGLQRLGRLAKLQELSVSQTRVSDDGLAHLKENYTSLDLSQTRITDQGVEHLQRAGQLVHVGLASTGITNNALKLLKAVPSLRQLDVAETQIDDNGLQHLSLLPELQHLNLNGTPVSDKGVDALLKLSTLRHVSLENSRVTAQGESYLKRHRPELKVNLVAPWVWGERWSHYDVAGVASESASTTLLQQLKSLTNLGYLRVSDSLLTREVLRSLKDLPTLEFLSFHGSSVTDDMLGDLIGLSQVVRLDLSNTSITDRGLAHLKYMQGLRELNLQGMRVTGVGFEHLADLSRLQSLNLRETPFQDGGLAELARLEELRKLELSGTRITDAGIAHLGQIPRLQYLDLYGTAITDAGVARLSRSTSLCYCYLSNTKITDAAIEPLRRLTELEELAVDGTPVTDDGLAHLHSMPNLRRLSIGRSHVTDVGLVHVVGLRNLHRLELTDLPVTDEGIELLLGLAKLRSLDLSGTSITDAALDTLARLPALTDLDVRDTAVTADAALRFRQAHPQVNLAFGQTRPGYSVWSIGLTVVYGIAVVAICFYGLHRYWLAWLFLRDRQGRIAPAPVGGFAVEPTVTVQLPMFNERQVAERIIEAACALRYPRECLQIQVLDDSIDESADMARRTCERLAAAGHPIEYLHRTDRAGFKGGALGAALEAATGEFIAVFDADFVPGPDFLERTIPYFTDAGLGVVQAEWSHLNRNESLLTELQAMFLDGHFVVEQAMRSRTGRWFNFNGTAGVWRRRCIEEAGGWRHDTLTEDTDLSYRAQLRGWRFLYLPSVRCPAELPSTMTAFLSQQHRWTKGLIQCARKLLPDILASRAPWRVKLEAWFHLTAPLMYLVMFLVALIALPALFLVSPFTDQAMLGFSVGLATLLLGTGGAATFYVVAQRAQGFSLARSILKLPLLMALGIGMCAVNARAVLEALVGFRSPFVRTPKFGGRRDCNLDLSSTRRRWRLPAGLVELMIAGVLAGCLVLSFLRPFTLIGAPFLLLFALGYAGVGLLSLLDGYRAAPQPDSAARSWRRPVFARLAVGSLAVAFMASIGATAFFLAAPPALQARNQPSLPIALGLDLTTATWKAVGHGLATPSRSAIRRISIERGSLLLHVQLDEQTDEGEIILDLDRALEPLGDSMGPRTQLTFEVEFPARFTGELQAFVRDSGNRSEYGSIEFVEGHDLRQTRTVALAPSVRVPPMGYQDQGFDPGKGIRQIGLKISATSDRVRGAGYRSFRGTIRIAKVRVSPGNATADPEIRPASEERPLSLPTPAEFLAGSGVDRPWPLGYGFSGPLTAAHRDELERTYAAVARLGCRFTRVYLGDYRTGLLFDREGKITGIELDFATYLDVLAEIANRHGIVVMFSLTDNTMADGRGLENVELIREGPASERFVNNVLADLIAKLHGRQVIWDIFNEPENVTAIPLREVQGYVERVLAAGRRADPQARFTVVSRSRPEIAYWQGRGLDLHSHNIFTPRSLQESLTAPRRLDAPIMVAEMAPQLAKAKNLSDLREAGYSGVGIWGWGTRDRYNWDSETLVNVAKGFAPMAGAKQ